MQRSVSLTFLIVLSFSASVFIAPASIKAQVIAPQDMHQDNKNGVADQPSNDCSDRFELINDARARLDRDRRNLEIAAGPVDDGRSLAVTSAGDLQQDIKLLTQREQEWNQCRASHENSRQVSSDCSSEPLLNFQVSHDGEPGRDVLIRRLPGSSAFFYESGMTIDADGAPNAYHPDNIGLDDLANAGAPGNWQGLAQDGNGEPFVQGPDDPYPGYFVSATALSDRTKAVNDPTRYVDASKVPFIVLPGGMARQMGARPGDFAAVFNQRSAKSSYAIFADVGPYDRIGEGSMALADNLGIRSDARNGGARRGVLYVVFPGSGNGRPRSVDEISSETENLLRAWGGTEQLAACSNREAARQLAERDAKN